MLRSPSSSQLHDGTLLQLQQRFPGGEAGFRKELHEVSCTTREDVRVDPDALETMEFCGSEGDAFACEVAAALLQQLQCRIVQCDLLLQREQVQQAMIVVGDLREDAGMLGAHALTLICDAVHFALEHQRVETARDMLARLLLEQKRHWHWYHRYACQHWDPSGLQQPRSALCQSVLDKHDSHLNTQEL